MDESVDLGAKRLGERLLVEVQVEGLSSVFKSLSEYGFEGNESTTAQQPTAQNTFFNIPPLDALFPTTSPSPPILELISPPSTHHPSNAGKTSLLYLIITHALLPHSIPPNTAVHGKNSAVILFDPLHHFSVLRLTQVMSHHLSTTLTTSRISLTPALKLDMKATVKATVKEALNHLHIFRPPTWPSLLATLDSLPDYLFDSKRHKSIHRRIHSLILEDIDIFTWHIRSNSNNNNNTNNAQTSILTSASTTLTTHLTTLSNTLSTAIILTSTSLSPPPILRPPLPTTWPPNTPHPPIKLGIRRIEAAKFSRGISAEGAESEREQRCGGVEGINVGTARFHCWRVGREGRDGGFVVTVGGRVGVEVGEGSV